jgi:hypothetical protein
MDPLLNGASAIRIFCTSLILVLLMTGNYKARMWRDLKCHVNLIIYYNWHIGLNVVICGHIFSTKSYRTLSSKIAPQFSVLLRLDGTFCQQLRSFNRAPLRNQYSD